MPQYAGSWQRRYPGHAQLTEWFASVNPLRVDIISDFAGKELFAIHGDALITYCLHTASVDFFDGFQLLHAVHAVESFLAKLKSLGCNFHLIWFEDEKSLCVPKHAYRSHVYKYALTRTILIEHFARTPTSSSSDTVTSRVFPSSESAEFRTYLSDNPLHFIMCSHDGATESETDASVLCKLAVSYRMSHLGYCVGFIDQIEIQNSKVYTSIITPSAESPQAGKPSDYDNIVDELSERRRLEETERSSLMIAVKNGLEVHQDIWEAWSLTLRDLVSLYTLSIFICQKKTSRNFCPMKIANYLIHLSILHHCKLSDRSFATTDCRLDSGDNMFLEELSYIACDVVSEWRTLAFSQSVPWDIYDLLDGRLYGHIRLGYVKRPLPRAATGRFNTLCLVLSKLTGGDDFRDDVTRYGNSLAFTKPSSAQRFTSTNNTTNPTVLAFSHSVVDSHLKEVQLDTEACSTPTTNSVFKDLTHWHNAKKLVDTKIIPKPLGFHAKRRHQRLMDDTMKYAASLSGATGKRIDPEVIIVQESGSAERSKSGTKLSREQQSASKSGKQDTKSGPASKKNQKSGREKALEAAQAVQAKKVAGRSSDILIFWRKQCVELEKEPMLVKRYLKAERYFMQLGSDTQDMKSEVSLYLCYILTQARGCRELVGMCDEDISAMIWSNVMKIRDLPITREIAKQLTGLSRPLGIFLNVSADTLQKREFPFQWPTSLAKISLPSSMTPLDFQLRHCGPYLERTFDSAPDSRVPFNPDAWQRKVLDAIDKDKSLFVVAPTSAGKTFISFYAMKKILQANNDDVLVYVAPTKALVNQVAAEIQARFTKSYHGEGQADRSVWAIHTRDYRVNHPHKCQILVTVPHILQIMLLAPSNSNTPNGFSRRVKRIIFDEVHCIGQSDEGVIWEQLLLLAPCPIIALSATVGNPGEFMTWLKDIQKAKGLRMEMIVHDARYSDLRHFIYTPPERYSFTGLASIEQLPIPGLDAKDNRFAFVHPFGATFGRNANPLGGVNLEPRDCLELWRSLVKHQNDKHPVEEALSPARFISMPATKSDVLTWASALKKQVELWIPDPTSPIYSIRQEFRAQCYDRISSNREKDSLSPDDSKQGAITYKHSTFALILDLRSNGGLPAIIFNYDRQACERTARALLAILNSAETEYKANSSDWKKKIADFEAWQRSQSRLKTRAPKKSKNQDDDGNKLDRLRDAANQESSQWDKFDPDEPLPKFSFAEVMKLSREELDEMLATLDEEKIQPELLIALRRGIGVHHSGMNRRYRQVVEMLFRRGFLTVVIATGTLALGINMPCKTVVFMEDSPFLSALNFRQAAGRAGRRGFDLLGNVVFHKIPAQRAMEIMSSRLPDLRGQFPHSVTLILRLFGLLDGTDDSEYAVNAVNSILAQNQLYLGGPEAQMSIRHHLRFSIDYLRRQDLLSETGKPLNFAGLVGHLYFTENAALAFHSLLKGGVFHKLSSGIRDESRRVDILREMMLILCHLFSRIPLYKHEDKTWLKSVVHRSPSLVILPDLPVEAATVLRKHNDDTLKIFHGYVHSYATQHLSSVIDNELPLTKQKIEPSKLWYKEADNIRDSISPLPETTVRSPFAALSGLTDQFDSIHELCNSVRPGVFLEESAIPYIRETQDGVPWNAYIYDFYKHGDLTALVRDNGIKRGDVWFHLKDFSLVLAAIVASLAGFVGPDASLDDDLSDLQGDDLTNVQDDDLSDLQDAGDVMEEITGTRHVRFSDEVEVCDGEEYDGTEEYDMEGSEEYDECSDGERSLLDVYHAFTLLRDEFDEKFRSVWA
ncbi:P-loop containing nucleoside triphosphate hydrolase protein [Xylariaceae sp. FL1272]|nr:P-loop containing nucleoside triphosphate hydrolase protein [Xylariaceae sp. FL1272]